MFLSKRKKMKNIDLRSDTVTLPTSTMRQAMFQAEVGDDVFGEDPTINRLEKMAAERFDKEAALFVASGTMGNLVCTLTHCARGEEAILGNKSHMFLNEAGGMSALGGIHPHIVDKTVPETPGLFGIFPDINWIIILPDTSIIRARCIKLAIYI